VLRAEGVSGVVLVLVGGSLVVMMAARAWGVAGVMVA
jgi:hypothetical protein